MKLTHVADWDTHHEGMDALRDIEHIVQKAFEPERLINRKTRIKILTGVHTSEHEPEEHILVEVDRGWSVEEHYVYVVREGFAYAWDRRRPVPLKTAHVPQAMTR